MAANHILRPTAIAILAISVVAMLFWNLMMLLWY
jgi:hypothetical protein